MLLASTKPGDVVLDPFFGTGTTGAVAKRLGRHFIGIEREQAYIAAAQARIAAVEPLAERRRSTVMTGKRAEPRIPFGTLIEGGLIAPGPMLTDARAPVRAEVRADGSLGDGEPCRLDPPRRRAGAGARRLQRLDLLALRAQGGLTPIDELRRIVRVGMERAGAKLKHCTVFQVRRPIQSRRDPETLEVRLERFGVLEQHRLPARRLSRRRRSSGCRR